MRERASLLSRPALILAAWSLAALHAPSALPGQNASSPGAGSRGEAVSPEKVLGYSPGLSERLPDWPEISGYFATLAGGSARVRIDTIGRSTLDAPMILATISSEANLARLDELREIQARLADPRRIRSPEERDRLISEGRLVVLITAGTHSTEVGGPIAAMEIAHYLATSSDATAARIRDEAIVLIVPAVNPDGIGVVKDWYEATRGTPWLGSDPPDPYHYYVGHDLNRDWYAFTQKEIRNLVERVHQVWHPHIDHDLHQQEATGARYFVPPWLDPVEPNVDPLLIAAATSLGTRVQWAMLEEGKTGVSVAARYDAWSPSRAYVHYHGGVRLLSETASARLAAPLELGPEDLRPTADLDPRASSWNHPIPWPGGRWGLNDIVAYMRSGVVATLSIAASEREMWLRNFERVGRRAVDGWPSWPEYWIIEAPGDRLLDSIAVTETIRILRTAGVEVMRADEAFRSEGRRVPEGSYVVEMHQPYAAFAQALLAPQEYPSSGVGAGPPRLYDVSAHNLPLLLGARAFPSFETPAAPLKPVERNPAVPRRHYAGVSGEPSVMVGLYRPWAWALDEGWTRFAFDRWSVPYTSITRDSLVAGNLLRDYTAVVIPSIPPDHLREGRPTSEVPPEFAGGLGPAEIQTLNDFVLSGGTLVALGESVDFVIDALGLAVENFVGSLPEDEFFAPGTQVGLRVDTTSRLARGMHPEVSAWLEGGAAFRVRAGGGMSIAARYANVPVLRSGWLTGGDRIAGRPAVVEIQHGLGHVVLFGIRPQYRGQSLATLPLLLNALRRRGPS